MYVHMYVCMYLSILLPLYLFHHTVSLDSVNLDLHLHTLTVYWMLRYNNYLKKNEFKWGKAKPTAAAVATQIV